MIAGRRIDPPLPVVQPRPGEDATCAARWRQHRRLLRARRSRSPTAATSDDRPASADPPPAPPRATANSSRQITGSRLYCGHRLWRAFRRRRPTSATPASSRRSTWHSWRRDDRPSFQFSRPASDEPHLCRRRGSGATLGVNQRRRRRAREAAGRHQQRLEGRGRHGWRRGTALGLFVAFLLAAFFSRRITKPLRRIGAAADRVAQGDLEVNVVGPNTGDDELGQLAQRFQGMVDRLREVDELERNFLMRVTHELRTPVTAISGPRPGDQRGPGRAGRARRLAGCGQRGGAADRAAGRRPARPDAAGGPPVPAGARGGRAGVAARPGRHVVPREGARRTTCSSTP